MASNFYKAFVLVLGLLPGHFSGAQTITTYSGTGNPIDSGDGGLASGASLFQPMVTAFDNSGNVYIGEGNGNKIRKVNSAGIISTFAGTDSAGYSGDGGLATAARFNGIFGMAFDTAGNLFVADYGNHVIRKINTNGIVSTFAGNGTAGYAGDAGQAIVAELKFPRDLKFDRTGNLYVCDGGNFAVRRISTTQVITTFAGTGISGHTGDGGQASAAQLGLPYRTGFDRHGNLFIVDGHNNCIRMVDTTGVITTVVGSDSAGFSGNGGPASAARLNTPTALAFDRNGNLYIVDRGNQRIRRVNATGNIYTFAGIGTPGDLGDNGLCSDAEINYPFDISFDAAGNLYVAEPNAYRLRRITPDPALDVASVTAANTSLTLMPNPNNGVFKINALFNTVEPVSISVTDVTGRQVYSAIVNSTGGYIDHAINTGTGWAAGMYVLQLRSLTETATSRFVINR